MYDYDRRTKTAATLDVYDKWRDIVKKHDDAEQKDFESLLKELVKYFKSVGYDLDTTKSWLGKRYSGSDGVRITGEFWITEREENNVKFNDLPRIDNVKMWVAEATDLYGYPKKVGEKETPRGTVSTFIVEIGE